MKNTGQSLSSKTQVSAIIDKLYSDLFANGNLLAPLVETPEMVKAKSALLLCYVHSQKGRF